MEQVIAIQEAQVAEHGGPPGIRDEDVDARFLLRPRRRPDPTSGVQGHAVDATPAAEIVEDLKAALSQFALISADLKK